MLNNLLKKKISKVIQKFRKLKYQNKNNNNKPIVHYSEFIQQMIERLPEKKDRTVHIFLKEYNKDIGKEKFLRDKERIYEEIKDPVSNSQNQETPPKPRLTQEFIEEMRQKSKRKNNDNIKFDKDINKQNKGR